MIASKPLTDMFEYIYVISKETNFKFLLNKISRRSCMKWIVLFTLKYVDFECIFLG